jgi:hypothetical protein
MKNRTAPIVAAPEPTEQEIQHAAYLLWIENGRPEGRDLEFWLAAREMLTHRHGRDATTGVPAVEISGPAPTELLRSA